MSLNDYLSHKRSAVLARDERIAKGKAEAAALKGKVSGNARTSSRFRPPNCKCRSTAWK